MELANVVASIGAPVEAVWELFSDFGGVDRLYPREGVPPLPPITSVEVTRAGVGSVRTVHMLEGDPVRERFTRCDRDALVIEYEALSLPIGVATFSARIQLRREAANRAAIAFTAQGVPTFTPEAEAREILTLLYTALIACARRVAEQRPNCTASVGN